MKRKTRTAVRMLLIGILSLCLLASIGCAREPDVKVIRGTSELFDLANGQAIVIPEGWSGAWMISDEALVDIQECCDNCVEN